MPKKCPKGYFCLNQVTIIGILFLLIIVIVFIFKQNYNNLYNKIENVKNENLIQNLQQQSLQQQQILQQENNSHHNLSNHHDHNIEPPTRYYNNNTRANMEINIETRGSSGDFQQIGILTKDSINDNTQIPGNNTDSNILPLYGKRLYRGSNKWYYYTVTDKFNSIKIPLVINNKDCTDDQGCEELNDGDNINIPAYNGSFLVKLYKFDKPRYIPIV